MRKTVIWAGFLGSILLSAQDDSLAQQSHHARELMAAGNYEEAIPIYRQLVKAVPGNEGLILNLGLAEQMAGHPERAIPQFELVLKTQPQNVPALSSLSMSYLQTGKPAPAIAPLNKLVALQPDNRNVRGMLAGAYLGTSHPVEAAAQYRKLVASDSADAKAWYGLGSAYEESANNSFDQLSKLAVTSPYLAALVAESRVQQGQYRSAFFFYRHAEESLPKLRGLHAGMAQVYRKTGHEDWAVLETQREVTQSCSAKTAECYFSQGHFLEASQFPAVQSESLFWKTKAFNALALDAFSHLEQLPESPELHAIKAEILQGHRQFKESAQEWQAALRLDPGNPRLLHERMTALFMARDYDAVIPLLESELKTDARSGDLNFMLGDSLLRTEHPDQAVPYLEAALHADNKMVAAESSLGLALAQTGKTAEAIPHLERALPTDDDGSVHYQLARAYQSAGQAERAKQMMTQYQAITAKNQSAKEEVAKEAEIVAPAQ